MADSGRKSSHPRRSADDPQPAACRFGGTRCRGGPALLRDLRTLGSDARGNRLALRCVGRAQDQVLLVEASRAEAGPHHVGFGTSMRSGLASAKHAAGAAGVRLLDPPGKDMPDGLWFHDPDGHLVNVQIASSAPGATHPAAGSTAPAISAGSARAARRSAGRRRRPRRLGHVLLFLDRRPAGDGLL